MARTKIKLEKLTTEQQARQAVVRDEWIGRSLGGDTSIDEANLRPCVDAIYRQAKLDPPPLLIICDSPLGCQLAANYLSKLKDFDPDSVGASVGASVRDSVGDSVGASVRASVWDSVGDSVGASVRASVGASVRASVWDSVRASVWDSVGASVRASVWDSVWASVRDRELQLFDWGWYSGLGFDASWTAFYDYFERIGVADLDKHEDWHNWKRYLKCGVWDAIWLKGAAIVCRRPLAVRKDEQGRIHSTQGPCVEWADGYRNYCLHGLRVKGDWIEDKGSITANQVMGETNVELRRALMSLMDRAKFIAESGAKVIHEDVDGGGQQRKLYRIPQSDDEDIVLVEVNDPSTGRQYHIRVNPDHTNCHEAVASTYRKTGSTYRPLVEA